MFTATLTQGYPRTPALTKGKEYEVIDFNEYSGTYTILDDAGTRHDLDWLSFADQGRTGRAHRNPVRQPVEEILCLQCDDAPNNGEKLCGSCLAEHRAELAMMEG